MVETPSFGIFKIRLQEANCCSLAWHWARSHLCDSSTYFSSWASFWCFWAFILALKLVHQNCRSEPKRRIPQFFPYVLPICLSGNGGGQGGFCLLLCCTQSKGASRSIHGTKRIPHLADVPPREPVRGISELALSSWHEHGWFKSSSSLL